MRAAGEAIVRVAGEGVVRAAGNRLCCSFWGGNSERTLRAKRQKDSLLVFANIIKAIIQFQLKKNPRMYKGS